MVKQNSSLKIITAQEFTDLVKIHLNSTKYGRDVVMMLTDNGYALDLTNVHLDGLYLEKTNLRGINFTGVKFKGCKLSGSDMRDCNFTDANMREAQLGKYVYGWINAAADYLSGRPHRPKMYGVLLDGANMTRVDLRDSDITARDFDNVILQGCLFPTGEYLGIWDTKFRPEDMHYKTDWVSKMEAKLAKQRYDDSMGCP